MTRKKEQTMTFEIPVTPGLRKTVEIPLRDAEDAPIVMYGEDILGNIHPVANITKHPECPEGWFDKFIASRLIERKELIDKACELYREELQQIQKLIAKIRTTAADVLDIEGSVADFRKAMEE